MDQTDQVDQQVPQENPQQVEQEKQTVRKAVPDIDSRYLENPEVRKTYLWFLDASDVDVPEEIPMFANEQGYVSWDRFEKVVRPYWEQVKDDLAREFGIADISMTSTLEDALVARCNFLTAIGFPLHPNVIRTLRKLDPMGNPLPDNNDPKTHKNTSVVQMTHPILGARMVADVKILTRLPLIFGRLDRMSRITREHPGEGVIDVNTELNKLGILYLSDILTTDPEEIAFRQPDIVSQAGGFVCIEQENRVLTFNPQSVKFGSAPNPQRHIDASELNREMRKVAWTLAQMAERKRTTGNVRPKPLPQQA